MSGWRWGVAWALVGLVISVVVLLAIWQGRLGGGGRAVEPTLQRPVGVVASPVVRADVLQGALGEKYLSVSELARFGAQADLTFVPYRASVALDDLIVGCPFIDCIPSIDAPRFEGPDALWLYDEDLVIGVAFEGEAKAYPISILNRHEVVNDRFGDVPVVVSYCPLCNSATAFVAPAIDGRPLEFGVSGRLYRADLVMYDRTTLSFWSQIEGRALIGPLAAASPPLARIPIDVSNWGAWRRAHPDTRVLARPTTADAVGGRPAEEADPKRGKRQFDYSEDPYRWYRGNDGDTYGLAVDDARLPNKALVIGVEVGTAAKAYPRQAVVAAGAINDVVDGVPFVIVYDAASDQVKAFFRPSGVALRLEEGTLGDGRARWALDGSPLPPHDTPLAPLYSLSVYWFAWASFHPQTQLWEAPATL